MTDVSTALTIDLLYNDVKQCFRGSNVHVGVVVTHESNMASYFPKAGMCSDMCSDGARPSSSGSGDLFELSDIGQIKL